MGGGGFLLIHMNDVGNKTSVQEFIDCRETAPAASTVDMYEDLSASASTDGGLSIAVPGELKGLEVAHTKYGVLPWSTVVMPAVKLAEDGVPVNDHLGDAIQKNADKILRNDALASVLSKGGDGKELLTAGDILRQPTLGRTLRAIMEQGSDAIYKGDLAEQLAEDIQQQGGIITLEDLENYTAAVSEPIRVDGVGGFTIIGAPPPSSGGGVLIGALRFLAGYETPYAGFYHTLSQHRLIEAMKHVFAIRMSLSDPRFNTNVTKTAMYDLTQGSYIDELREMTLDHNVLPLSAYGGSKWALLTDDNGTRSGRQMMSTSSRRNVRRADIKRTKFVGAFNKGNRSIIGLHYLDDWGTSHLSIVDKDRNAVAFTSTVNLEFGSGVLSPSTGILLNDEMDDFATPGRPNGFGLAPAEANYIFPGKRPLSSMSPTLMFHTEGENESSSYHGTKDIGKLFLVGGASGGPRIITATLQFILNHAMVGQSLQESIASPRVHNQLLFHGIPCTNFDLDPLIQGGLIELPLETKESLVDRGHTLHPLDYMGTVQAVTIDLDENTLSAVSDVRKGGLPSGY